MLLRYYFLTFFLLVVLSVSGQMVGGYDPLILPIANKTPTPKFDITEYINKNLVYPDLAKEKNIEGMVRVRFIINEDSSIGNIELMKGIGGGCDSEALRVVSTFPKMIPPTQNGKYVKAYFYLPIVFKLQ